MMNKRIANWGNYPMIESKVLSFGDPSKLRSLVQSEASVIARGNGRCYGDASLAPVTLLTLSYDKFLSFDKENGILECESGITLDQVLKVVVPQGWFLPVSPGTKFITIGGAVASNIHGKNHHVEGAFSKHVIDMDILLASGELVQCSATEYPDLFEASFGGMGLTGIITRVRFRLKKIESSYITQKQVKAENLEDILNLFEKYEHYTYSVAWIDCMKQGRQFGRSILILGEHTPFSELDQQKQANPFYIPDKKPIVFPVHLPSFVLNQFSIRAFNFVYYSKNRKKEINNIVHYEPFFYPLDTIWHWNRMYGRKGFVQYQFVIPTHRKEGLVEILQRISRKGIGSFLAVLKKFGNHQSIMSFPLEGYTLALDFPVRPGLFEFLDELDQIVSQHGGRVYLTKDARMRPEVFWSTYPNALKFKDIVTRYNPEFKFRSLQSDRLRITK
jgi:decaprenylphospho-beta-D-ribofuranose 2-oxidase